MFRLHLDRRRGGSWDVYDTVPLLLQEQQQQTRLFVCLETLLWCKDCYHVDIIIMLKRSFYFRAYFI